MSIECIKHLLRVAVYLLWLLPEMVKARSDDLAHSTSGKMWATRRWSGRTQTEQNTFLS